MRLTRNESIADRIRKLADLFEDLANTYEDEVDELQCVPRSIVEWGLRAGADPGDLVCALVTEGQGDAAEAIRRAALKVCP